jgi:hypothetical protein
MRTLPECDLFMERLGSRSACAGHRAIQPDPLRRAFKMAATISAEVFGAC